MTDPRETLNRIRKQANAATEGPWEHEPPPGPGEDPMRPICVYPKEDGGTLAYVQPLEADAEFIAHSRTDVPDMAAALRAVLELHAPDYTYPDCPKCSECSDIASTEAQRFVVLWPCATVEAIRQHIGDDL